jgi:GH24 family phage-related lysozyme (muramidase)
LKKSSITWNTVLTFLSGGLLLYVLSRIFRKKENQQNENQPVDKGISFSPTPLKSEPTYEEYFNWLRLKENVTYTAKPDGKDAQGNTKYSIGMGHQIQPGEEYLFNATISEQKVRELFKDDIEKIVKDVNSVVKVPLTRNQKLALVSIRYNVGPGGFRSGKLLSTLNTGNYAGVAAIIPTFIVTSNGGIFNIGLQNRRKTEQALFVKAN